MEAAAHGQRRALDCEGLNALDLRTLKPNERPWDLPNLEGRNEAERLQDEQKQEFVIGSPPCPEYSQLNWGLNFPKMTTEEVERRWKDGMSHIDFVCSNCRCLSIFDV